MVEELRAQVEPVVEGRHEVALVLSVPQVLVVGERVVARYLLLVALQARVVRQVGHPEMEGAQPDELLKVRLVRAIDARLVLGEHQTA